jgi:hypothetical protein
MPMHDWTRADAGVYHHLHGRWLYAISAALNAGLLPAEYYALAEQVVRPFEPDGLALQRRRPGPPPRVGGAATARAAHPPAVRPARVVRPAGGDGRAGVARE